MTRLTQDDIDQLRSAYATINVADEQPPGVIPTRIAEEAARKINQLSLLPDKSISPEELRFHSRQDPEENITQITFTWEPSCDQFAVELLGGPKDGEKIMIQERNKGHIKIAHSTQSDFGQELTPFASSVKHGTYKETGWDTDKKVWLYTWTDK